MTTRISLDFPNVVVVMVQGDHDPGTAETVGTEWMDGTAESAGTSILVGTFEI